MLLSGIEQSDSVIHIYILFLDSFLLVKDIEYSSLHYTVGACKLSSLYVIVCIF